MLKRFVNSKKYGYVVIVVFIVILFVSLFEEMAFGSFAQYDKFVLSGIAIMAIIFTGFLLRVTYSILLFRRLQNKFNSRKVDTLYRDLTEENIDIPVEFQPSVSEIEFLELSPFAVLGFSDEQGNDQILLYWTNDSHTVRASLVRATPTNRIVSSFTTILEDKAMIQTVYNVRMQMDTDTLHIRNVTSSLSATYDFHLQQIANYENQHGKPISITSSTELIELSNYLGGKNQRDFFEHRIQSTQKYMVLYIVLIIVCIVALFLSQWVNLMSLFGLVGIVMGICIIFFKSSGFEEAFGSVEERKKQKN